mmetsp:Transcript_18139/g.17288  ORF Transcript_18139/g.17288 Transcript_18139/m.17288 type:complete len:91 (+) Transcript_18139:494-766(+)
MKENKKLNWISSIHKLTPLEVDFEKKTVTPIENEEATVAFQIDSMIDLFNRTSDNDNVVLVHCAMGASRSATCVIMYIMKKFKVSFEDAL